MKEEKIRPVEEMIAYEEFTNRDEILRCMGKKYPENDRSQHSHYISQTYGKDCIAGTN